MIAIVKELREGLSITREVFRDRQARREIFKTIIIYSLAAPLLFVALAVLMFFVYMTR